MFAHKVLRGKKMCEHKALVPVLDPSLKAGKRALVLHCLFPVSVGSRPADWGASTRSWSARATETSRVRASPIHSLPQPRCTFRLPIFVGKTAFIVRRPLLGTCPCFSLSRCGRLSHLLFREVSIPARADRKLTVSTPCIFLQQTQGILQSFHVSRIGLHHDFLRLCSEIQHRNANDLEGLGSDMLRDCTRENVEQRVASPCNGDHWDDSAFHCVFLWNTTLYPC